MTLNWPPEKTFEYDFKEEKELTMVIPLVKNEKGKDIEK